jgi:hypothetical protein
VGLRSCLATGHSLHTAYRPKGLQLSDELTTSLALASQNRIVDPCGGGGSERRGRSPHQTRPTFQAFAPPAAVLFAVFVLYLIGKSVSLSFYDFTGFRADHFPGPRSFRVFLSSADLTNALLPGFVICFDTTVPSTLIIPFIVPVAISATFRNIAFEQTGKRPIEQALVGLMTPPTVDNPGDATGDSDPLIDEVAARRCARTWTEARDRRGRLVCEVSDRTDGAWQPLRLVAEVGDDTTLGCGMDLGGIATIATVRPLDDAIAVVVLARYGLVCGLHTADLLDPMHFPQGTRTGVVKVTGATTGADNRAPFSVDEDSSYRLLEQGTAVAPLYTTKQRTTLACSHDGRSVAPADWQRDQAGPWRQRTWPPRAAKRLTHCRVAADRPGQPLQHLETLAATGPVPAGVRVLAPLDLQPVWAADVTLITGTSLVPPSEISLHDGDEVTIRAAGLGALDNTIITVGTAPAAPSGAIL